MIETNIAELHYNEYGTGESSLLILHGFLGASGNWHTLARNVFSKHRHVYALDMRNHGESPHADIFDYQSMVSDVVHFIESRRMGPVDLLGHSMGGKVAMQVAVNHPDLVRDLIVADIVPTSAVGGHMGILDALETIDLTEPTSRKLVDAELEGQVPSPAIRQFLLKNLRSTSGGRYKWTNNLPVLSANYRKLGEAVSDGQFDGKVLFVKGGRSAYIEDHDWPDIVARFPRARLVVLEGVGHWVHAEAPERFSDAVVDFLNSER